MTHGHAGRPVADATSLTSLAEALREEGAMRGVARRYGRFNDAYYDEFAAALIARQKALQAAHSGPLADCEASRE